MDRLFPPTDDQARDWQSRCRTKPPLRIHAWQQLLQQHRTQLLDCVDPKALIDYLQADGLTEAEASLVMKPTARSAQVSRLCHVLGTRPAMATTLTASLRQAGLPLVAKAIEIDLQGYDLQDLNNPPPPFEVSNASRFRAALSQLGSYMEPLCEWALPQLVARGCLTAQEENKCLNSTNPRETFISCLEKRSPADFQQFVQQLHEWRCYGLLCLLRNAYAPRIRQASEARSRSWNLPIPALHYTKRVGVWQKLEVAMQRLSRSEGHWVLLSGIAACGKSSAAVEAAYTALEEDLGFDHVVWLKANDADEEAVIGQAHAAITYGLDGHLANSVHDAKTLRNQMEIAAFKRQKSEKILLVLDDVWEETLPMKFTAFAHVIVTSRNAEILRNSNMPFSHIEIPEALTREESLAVVSSIFGEERFSSLRSNDLDDLETVLSRLDRLPLVVNVIAAHLKRNYQKWTGHASEFFRSLYSDVFTKNSSRIRMPAEQLLQTPRAEGQYGYVNIYAALLLSIDRLEEKDKEAYMLFMILPRGRAFSEEMPALVWDVSSHEADDRLDRFCTLNILQQLHYDSQEQRCWYRLHNLIYNTFLINYDDQQRREQHRRLVRAYQAVGLDKVSVRDLYFYRYFAEHCHRAKEPGVYGEALRCLSYIRNRLAIPPESASSNPLELIYKDIESCDRGLLDGSRCPVTILYRKLRRLRNDPVQVDDIDTSFLQQCLLLPATDTLHRQALQEHGRCLWVQDLRPLPCPKDAVLFLWLPEHNDWLLLTITDDQWRLTLISANKVLWSGPTPLAGTDLLSASSGNVVAFGAPEKDIIVEFSIPTKSWRSHKLWGSSRLTCLAYNRNGPLYGLENGTVLHHNGSEWTEEISLSDASEIQGLITTKSPVRCIAFSQNGAIATSGPTPWRCESQKEWRIKTAALSSDEQDILLLISRYQNPIFFSCRIQRVNNGQHMLNVMNCCIDGSAIVPNPYCPTQFAIPAKNGLAIICYARHDVEYTATERKRRGFEVGEAVWCDQGQCLLFTGVNGSCCCYDMRSESISLTYMTKQQKIRTIRHETGRKLLVSLQDKMLLFQRLQRLHRQEEVHREEDSGCERPSDTDESSDEF